MRYIAAALLLILAYLAWNRPKPEAVWTGWRDLEAVDSV